MGEGLQAARLAANATRGKLTPAQLRVLHYLSEREFVSAWPIDVCPQRKTRDLLERAGLMERFGHDPGTFGFIRFRITQSGRDALQPL